jgi:hypothetical protein
MLLPLILFVSKGRELLDAKDASIMMRTVTLRVNDPEFCEVFLEEPHLTLPRAGEVNLFAVQIV